MKAFILDRYGSNDVVRAGEMPDPELHYHDVLVQIHAASVNPVDLKIRDGKLKLILPYRLPFILGNDLAGVVVRVGSGVRRFRPGDEVFARPDEDRIGAFAEFISIKEDAVAHKPKKLTMEEAASIPLIGLTAWQALVERANLKTGQKVLIHAGSGGVGTFAIQLAKHLGAIVATTTSTANVEWVKRLGADIVIDYKKDDFANITLIRYVTDVVGEGPTLHVHPYDEIFTITEGRARFTVGDRTIDAEAGDVVLGPANIPHGYQNLGPGRLDSLDIHLSPEWIQYNLASAWDKTSVLISADSKVKPDGTE